jgi:hypothetical protein
MGLEALLAPRRRGWILATAVATTLMFSWASIARLGELVEVQQLPSDVATHSLLELTEQNIASHLHLPRTGAPVPPRRLWRRRPAARYGRASFWCAMSPAAY